MAQVNIDVAKEASVQAVNTTVGTVNTSVQAVNTKVGTSGDTASNAPTTLFSGIKSLIAWFTGTWTAVRAGYVDSINTNTAVNNTASKTGTLSQKGSYGIGLLENATYGLSALKTVITGGGTPVVKSVQRLQVSMGYIEESFSIATVNENKCIVIIDGSTYSTAHYETYLPYLKQLSSTAVILKLNGKENNNVPLSIQIIEFY